MNILFCEAKPGRDCIQRYVDGRPTGTCARCGKKIETRYTNTDEYKTTCNTCGSIQAFANAWQRDRAAERHAGRCGR